MHVVGPVLRDEVHPRLARSPTVVQCRHRLEDRAWRLSFFGEELESVHEFDPLTGERTATLDRIRVYANSHYVTPRPTMQQAIKGIRSEVAGDPDILLAPDLEAGNILAKQLSFLARADSAGLGLGALRRRAARSQRQARARRHPARAEYPLRGAARAQG